MAVSRRYFLKSGGLTLFGVGFVPSFLRRTAFAMETGRSESKRKVLVAIFQRGAADGLNIVVPFAEKHYYTMRPTISVPAPTSSAEQAAAAIDLDGFFGLHPSLASLKPLFDERHLAIVHAAGSPDNTRSHFDAQDYMETATPGVKATTDGWLNRYLQGNPEAEASPFRAVALAPRMPRTLRGSAAALVMDNVQGFRLAAGLPARALASVGGPPAPVPQGGMPREGLSGALEAMYASTSDPLLDKTAKEMFEAMATLERVGHENYQPANGVVYPGGPLGRSLQQIAQLIKAGVGLEVAFAEVGGWDHHVNEGGVQGQLAFRLKDFGDALAAFHRDLGDRMQDVVVLTMSEFGRTARENGNRGTDHGHANAMFILGGAVKGGKVYGKWPGLRPDELNEGRDLALTTDFRDVFAEVMTRHIGARETPSVFPGFSVSSDRFRGFLG